MDRQTFLNRFEEVPAELNIENLDGRKAPDPITPGQVDEGLKTASLFVGGASLLFARWAKSYQQHTNKLPQFDPATSNAAGGDPNIIYYQSHWKLGPEQALEIFRRVFAADANWIELTKRLHKPGFIPDTPEGRALVEQIVTLAE